MRYFTFYLLTVFLVMSISAFSQKPGEKKTRKGKKERVSVDSAFNKNSKTFVAIPIINNNPTMKTGFGANTMYIFKINKKDKKSQPSMVSLMGFYTTNKSYVVVPMASLFWNENKNRAMVVVGTVGINHDHTYTDEGTEEHPLDPPEDITLVYKEMKTFFWLEYSRKVIGDLYLGVNYSGAKVSYKFDQGTDEENQFTEDFFEKRGITDDFISSLGLNIFFDSRDYVYYPTTGYQLVAKPKFYQTWLGSDNNYTDTDIKLIGYFSLRSNMVLASMIYGGFSTGDVPFSGYQSYGMRNNLRGYPTGKYRGKYMITGQAELRWRFYRRWGAVFFAGTGSIWGSEDDEYNFATRSWLPAAGAGARFMISRVKKINIRVDYAIGVDGNMGLYFGMMEAF